MTNKLIQQSIILIEEVVKDLENPKGSVSSAIIKLNRIAELIDNKDLKIWCEIQLGSSKYIPLFKDFVNKIKSEDSKTKNKSATENAFKELKGSDLKEGIHYSIQDLNHKINNSLKDVSFIENKYNDFIKSKKGNDGTYYLNSLNAYLSYLRTTSHSKATEIYKKISFQNAPESSFDVLRKEIDDKLLDLNPEMAEQIMIAFKSLQSSNQEEWSHSLTTCRRFIEKLADLLYPPTEEVINNRKLGKEQYINRIWMFMDDSIRSESNKVLAKAHVDFVGNYLQKIHKITNKGVHTSINRIEAIKCVFHLYLLLADILEFLNTPVEYNNKLNIHTATLDEIESIANIKRSLAKEIIKARVESNILNEKVLSKLPGFGEKTIKILQDKFSFESIIS